MKGYVSRLSLREHPQANLPRSRNKVKRPAVAAAVFLILLCIVLVGYRVVRLGYPLLPAATINVWQLSMEALLAPDTKGLKVRIGLPDTGGGRTITEERITSGGLDFIMIREGSNQIGVWSGNTDSHGSTYRLPRHDSRKAPEVPEEQGNGPRALSGNCHGKGPGRGCPACEPVERI